MGYCILECEDGGTRCCICCPEREERGCGCDDMNGYEYAEDCPNYVKEGDK